jgi:hypothetical protein
MARTPRGQKKSDARMEVESIVNQYLHSANIEHESTQEVTLPANKEGKVNVSELSEQMGLSESQRKNHVYKDDDILFEINRHAEIQGILPIKHSKYKEHVNEDARHKLAMSNKRAKESDDQLVEVQSQNDSLHIEIRKVKAELEQYKACIEEYYRTGIMPVIVEID